MLNRVIQNTGYLGNMAPSRSMSSQRYAGEKDWRVHMPDKFMSFERNPYQ